MQRKRSYSGVWFGGTHIELVSCWKYLPEDKYVDSVLLSFFVCLFRGMVKSRRRVSVTIILLKCTTVSRSSQAYII